MLAALRLLWFGTRGHRFAPWRSPYLRWRLETYSGLHAEEVGLADFCRLAVKERRQLLRFLRWLSEMKTYAAEPAID
jgi:hypothetical protein